MNNAVFTGACTALVTPFLHGEINYPLLQRLILRQIENGITAIVIGGTTGESATLTDMEKLELFRMAKKYAGKDAVILAGTGSNSTEHALALSVAAQDTGVDGLLVVSPYYNKATEAGLVEHYGAIASAVKIPVIVYNVPSRTGLDIPVEVYRQLSRLENIAGVKEASPDITKVTRIRIACPGSFRIWTGNDELIVPAMALGCSGVISVVANVLPLETQAMAQAALAGDFDTASALQEKLSPLIAELFREVNPVPVKEAMKLIGYDCGECRLPLTALMPENRKGLAQALQQATADSFRT